MNKYMFYCKRCESAYSGGLNQTSFCKCPECGTEMLPMMITKDEWNRKSKDEKDELKGNLKEKDKTTNFKIEHFMADDIHQIREDIHFMKTVLYVFVVLYVLGIIISLFF